MSNILQGQNHSLQEISERSSTIGISERTNSCIFSRIHARKQPETWHVKQLCYANLGCSSLRSPKFRHDKTANRNPRSNLFLQPRQKNTSRKEGKGQKGHERGALFEPKEICPGKETIGCESSLGKFSDRLGIFSLRHKTVRFFFSKDS